MTIIKINEETIYAGPRFDVKRADFLRPDGTAVKREWIEPGNAVAVLPYSIKDNYFVLARQPREITGREVLSLCAGQIDAGENPVEAARRELGEELSLRTNRPLECVGVFYSSEGITDEKTYIFLAEDPIADEGTVYDGEEAVTQEEFSLDDLPTMLSIVDNAKAAIALQALQLRLYVDTVREARAVLGRLV